MANNRITPEQKLVRQIGDAVADYRFQPNSFPYMMQEQDDLVKEKFAQLALLTFNYWSTLYTHDKVTFPVPSNLGLLSNCVIGSIIANGGIDGFINDQGQFDRAYYAR